MTVDAIGIGKSLEYLALGLIWARMINNIHDGYLGVDPTRKHDRCIARSPCRDWNGVGDGPSSKFVTW